MLSTRGSGTCKRRDCHGSQYRIFLRWFLLDVSHPLCYGSSRKSEEDPVLDRSYGNVHPDHVCVARGLVRLLRVNGGHQTRGKGDTWSLACGVLPHTCVGGNVLREDIPRHTVPLGFHKTSSRGHQRKRCCGFVHDINASPGALLLFYYGILL